MKVLVSFCNQTEKSLQKNLLLLDLDSGEQAYLFNEGDGFAGLSQDENFYYAISQNPTTGLVIIDKRTKKVVLKTEMEHLADPHAMLVDREYIYIVSTGTGRVLKYLFNKDKLTVEFKGEIWHQLCSKSKSDVGHINSIGKYKGSLLVAGFGPKKASRWSSAKNGYIYNITKKKKLISRIYHPHSIFPTKNNVFFCESSSRSVMNKHKHVILKIKSGYVRGLALKEKSLVLGTSCGRKTSKSTGLVNNFADPGLLEAECRVLLFRKRFWGNYKLEKEFNFYPGHNEIYYIMIVQE